MASAMTARMRSSSSAVALPIAMPLPTDRSVPPPRNDPMLGETPAVIMASSQSRKRVHVLTRGRHSSSGKGKIACAMGSVLRPRTGAGVHASPMISVVTPCVILERQRPSIMSGRMEWLWMSMKPGQTTMPAASITVAALLRSSDPGAAMAAMRSPRMARSP